MNEKKVESKVFSLNEIELKENGISFCGRQMALKDFRSFFDCDVEFIADGYVAEHVNYGCYYFGNIKHPDDIFVLPPEIGETGEARGRKFTIVDMSSKSNVAYMFEDGRVITGRTYSERKRGYFGDIRGTVTEDGDKECYVGETIINKQGYTATISRLIDLGRSRKPRIDVTFERDGEKIVVENQTYRKFKSGGVLCPLRKKPEAMEDLQKLPKTIKTSDGHIYKLENVISSSLVDVLVDGVLVKNVDRSDYLNETVNVGKRKNYFDMLSHIGETGISNSGVPMQICVWRNASDIDILLGAGDIARHRTYQNFQKGKVISERENQEIEDRKAKKKNVSLASKLAQIGRSTVNCKGQRMALWKYHNENDVRVIFENTGNVVRGTWYSYRNGFILDPEDPESLRDAFDKANERDKQEGEEKAMFRPFVSRTERVTEAVIEQVSKDIWGRSRADFNLPEGEDPSYIRACDISRKLDGYAMSLRTCSMAAIEPFSSVIKSMAEEAMNISVRLRKKEASIDEVFGEIQVLANVVQKGADDKTGNVYVDDVLTHTANYLNGLLK